MEGRKLKHLVVGLTMGLTLVQLAFAEAISNGADLPQWDMATSKDIGKPWSKPGQDGEVTYRSIKGKRAAGWSVPAWWGAGVRPAYGTVYMLDILYKDILSSPAVFCTDSALKYGRFAEVHRFGGTGDQKWKTASVPVSWDLIRKTDKDNARFALSTGGQDLPVSKISVRLAGKDDAMNYFQETREWIAKLKQGKYPDFKLQANSNVVIAAGIKSQAIIPFVRPYVNKIGQNSAPQEGETDVPLKIRMTLDEYEPGTFGVYANGKDLKGVTYEMSDLVGAKGKLDCRVDLRTAEYIPIADRKSKKVAMSPIRLWRAYPVDIPAGFSHGFWLTLRTDPVTCKAGMYKGTVTVRSGGEKAVLPMEVEVLPVKLLTVDEINIPVGGCVPSYPPEQEMETYKEHNQRALHVFY